MGRNMANPFKWEHLLYGLAGLTIGALLKKRNAKKLEAIDKLIAMLQALKDAVILNDREAVEKTLDAIMAIYSELS